MYVVNIVQVDSPTELSVGPWDDYEECCDWVSRHYSDRMTRIQIIEMTKPWDE